MLPLRANSLPLVKRTPVVMYLASLAAGPLTITITRRERDTRLVRRAREQCTVRPLRTILNPPILPRLPLPPLPPFHNPAPSSLQLAVVNTGIRTTDHLITQPFPINQAAPMTHSHPLTPHQSPFHPILPLCNNQTRTPPNTRLVEVASIWSIRTIRSRIPTPKEQDKEFNVHTLLEGLGTETTVC